MTIYETIYALSEAVTTRSGGQIRKIVVDETALNALIGETKPSGHYTPDGLLTWFVATPAGKIEITCFDGEKLWGKD